MKSVRTTISITPSVYAKAQDIMKVRDFSDFSGLLHQLIREEWERRRGPVLIREKPARKVKERAT